jgi:3-oxoacyl-[acyl-carrier protein] reductase
VLISGGARGLGAGLVERFLAAGDRVATFSRRPSERVTAWQQDPRHAGRFRFAALDATDGAGVRELVSGIIRDWGSIQVLVNNAAVARDGLLALVNDGDVDELLEVNVKAVVRLTRLVVRDMLLGRGGRGGRIVTITSIVGRSGHRGLSVYGATKAALDGFTRGLARELGVKGITVNAIAPGYLRTEMSHGLGAAQLERVIRRTPLGRLGEVADVAELAHFLTTDGASFITGQTLVVDGGLTC